MKVTIKRPIGTTVPRKLELVNVHRVEASASHGGKPMITSQSRAANGSAMLPMCGGSGVVPPFWELEDLIGRGFTYEAALAVMAAKRSEHDVAFQAPEARSSRPAQNEPLTVVLGGR